MSDNKNGLDVVPLLINGQHHDGRGSTFPVISAIRNETVHSAHSANVEDAVMAIEAAQNSFKSWSTTTAFHRRDIINRAADIMQSRKDELVRAQIEETSCSEGWATFNVISTVGAMKEIAARITTACSGEVPPTSTEGTFGVILKEAIGPVLLIAPWNAAIFLAARGLSTILAAGCTTVFKASELCPKTHHILSDIFSSAGVPSGVINVIQTARQDAASVTEAIIAHPSIRKVEFIGSASVGRIIGSLAGRHLKPVLMELGGKGACIVLEDADLEAAATKAIGGAFIHHGQVCFSSERIIVMKPIADDFIQLLRKKASEYEPGHSVNERVSQNAHDCLKDAEAKGAKFILGKPEYRSKTSLAPALLTNVQPGMKMYDEETFGPSSTVIVVEDEEELVAVVNRSQYGLDAFLHTRDMLRAMRAARQLEVGRVRVNGSSMEPAFPLNATKASGWGRGGAGAGIEEFLIKKIVMMDFN